jgi:hypothetical protein
MKIVLKTIILICLVFFAIIAFIHCKNECNLKVVFLKYSYIRGSSPYSHPSYYYNVLLHKKNKIHSVSFYSLNDSLKLEDIKISFIFNLLYHWEVKHVIREKSNRGIFFYPWDYQISLNNSRNALLLVNDEIIQVLEQHIEDSCVVISNNKTLRNITVYRNYLEEHSCDWYTEFYIDLSKELLIRVYSNPFGDMTSTLDLVQADTIQNPSDNLKRQIIELFDWLNK